jgi:hypothetical protein
MKASRIITVVAAATLLLEGRVMAGGACPIIWDNDASSYGNSFGWVYTDITGGTLVPAGNTIDLVAISGNTYTILAASAFGQDAVIIRNLGDPSDGAFNIASVVASNILQGVIGQTLGVLVYNGTAEALITPTGDYAVTSPDPNWASPPVSAVNVELDADPAASVTLISGQAAGFSDNGGFYVQEVVPEPSTFALAGLGALTLLGGRRMRRRS